MEKCGLQWILSLILCSMFLLFVNFPCFALDSIGQMVWVKGTVKAAQPNQAARILVRRSPIYVTDTITTNANSTGQIVFTDNSLLALRTNTVLEIAKYKFNKAPLNKDNSFLADVAKGGFRTITGTIAKEAPNNYQTKTPVATIGVSGTDYTIYYDATTKKLDTMITAGAILVKNSLGSQKLDATCRPQETFCYRVASVESNKAPKSSNKIPDSLKTVKIIVPATFDPNATPDHSNDGNLPLSGGGTSGSSGTGSSGGSGSSGGTVTGFSINQPCS